MKKIALIFGLILLMTGCGTVLINPDGPSTFITEDNVKYSLHYMDYELARDYGYASFFANKGLNTTFLLLVENQSDKVVNLPAMADAALIDFHGIQHQMSKSIRLGSSTRSRLTRNLRVKSSRNKYNNASSVTMDPLVREMKQMNRQLQRTREEELAFRRKKVLNKYKRALRKKVIFSSGKVFPGGSKVGLLVFPSYKHSALSRFGVKLITHQDKLISFDFQLIIQD
jgi:hypothetical protein